MSNSPLPRAFALAAAVLLAQAPLSGAHAQAWKPAKPIEIIVGAAPGGGADSTARVMQKLMQERLLPEVSSAVVNKSGAASALSYVYLNQHPGDGHYVALSLQPMLTAPVVGASVVRHTDLTPLAQLFNEYVGFAVRPDSPIQSAADMLERLRRDPASISIGLSTALGGSNHLATAIALKAGGVDVRRLRIVVVKGAPEAITGVIGGHMDALALSASSLIPFLESGKLRGIAVSAPRRLAGAYAGVPSWSEVVRGNAAYANWRGVVGPRGMTPAQIAFWDDVLGRLAQSEEWKADLAKRQQDPAYMASRDTKRFLDEQYEELRAVLVQLGLAK